VEENKQVSDSRKKLLNFIDIKILKNILDAFTDTTGLMANIVDVEGISIFSRKDITKCCKFCRIIYGLEHGMERCQGAYKRAGKQAAIFQEPYIFRCPAGLIEWAAPIIVEGQHLGTIICGQVLMWKPEEFFWIELREMNKELTSDFTELFQAVEELPIISAAEVKSASYLLYVIANYIMKSGWENYIHVRELTYQQSLLYEEVQNRKLLEKKLSEQTFFYSIDKEQAMMAKVKVGDQEGARKEFQALMTDIVMSGGGELPIIKTRIIELCTILSRTAVSVGGDLDASSQANGGFFERIFRQTSVEETTAVAFEILEYYLDRVREAQENPGNVNVQQMIDYMRENFRRNLTLEEITDSAFLSVSYGSRLFKKIHRVSIMEYLLQIRMEEAKKLLHNPHYLIDEIAVKTGYGDAGYFTKVFKKYEGVTPTQYRQSI
jgi:two-component system response regulator YesN